MEVAELFNVLVSKGIKLSFDGEHLNSYGLKGSLTKELSEGIAQNKAKIISILRSHSDVSAVSDAANNSKMSLEAITRTEDSRLSPRRVTLNLEAEAVLDPGIQPPARGDGDTDFTAARAILLTGASGFVGAYLLRDIVAVTDASIYCLVRSTSKDDGERRIKDNLTRYGLWSDACASRIVAVSGDLARPLLGVGAETFDSLCNVIDVIYHNGALVNFIYPYANLKDANVHGTEEVIRLACSVKRKPLHYISTIGVFPPATDGNTRVLESDPAGNWQGLVEGYRQSKWVAEKLVAIAADRGLPVRIYRPGFVTGDSTTGVWNTDDFLPRLIKGCIQLGTIPESNAMIEMVPVDYVSKTIVHLSRQQELRSNVFHVVNPTYTPAKRLGDIVGSLGYKMRLVSYSDWRHALLEDAKTSSNNALFPLLTMFTDASPLEQVQAFDCRETLKGLRGTQLVCPEISTDLMATYLAYFKSSGFLAA